MSKSRPPSRNRALKIEPVDHIEVVRADKLTHRVVDRITRIGANKVEACLADSVEKTPKRVQDRLKKTGTVEEGVLRPDRKRDPRS